MGLIQKGNYMSMDTVIAIVCLACAVVFYGIYRYFSESVKITYKDQRVGE